MKLLQLRHLIIGEGMPKVCVPIVGKNLDQIECSLAALQKFPGYDMVEWRADFFEQITTPANVLLALAQIRRALRNTILLFTCRNKQDGGASEISGSYYQQLCTTVIQSQIADCIDIEFSLTSQIVQQLITQAQAYGVATILSSHDVHRTPSQREMVQCLCNMQTFPADILKLAVTPQQPWDVLALLNATLEMQQYAQVPIMTVSMGDLGKLSRLAGILTGSCITFGMLDAASAPGQMSTNQLKSILSLLDYDRRPPHLDKQHDAPDFTL